MLKAAKLRSTNYQDLEFPATAVRETTRMIERRTGHSFEELTAG